MALFVAKGNMGKMCFLASQGGKLMSPSLVGTSKIAFPASVQVAHITAPANQLEKVQRPKPWPYKTMTYNSIWQMFDKTNKRIDENSKVICVEGNMGVGKTAFAKKLAQELDFHYVAETPHDAFGWDHGKKFHKRELNPALPEEWQFFDLQKCYRQENPESGQAGMLQLNWFTSRIKDYAQGLEHLFNTGQGVVFDRSVWSELVYTEALKNCGFLKPAGYRYIMENRRVVICEMFKPHVTIYLDSPPSMVMENIRKRNIDYEVNSKIMSEKYVEEIDNGFKNVFLPLMKKHGEALVYDANNLEDWEIIIEDIERLNLEPDPEDDDSSKFTQWDLQREDDLAYFRKLFGWKLYIERLFRMPLPWQSPELMFSFEQSEAVRVALATYKRSQFSGGYTDDEPFLSKLFEMKR